MVILLLYFEVVRHKGRGKMGICAITDVFNASSPLLVFLFDLAL